MTPRQIEQVQSSWKSVLPIRDTFAEIFYGKLFSLDARLAPMFQSRVDGMQDQGRSVVAMLSIAVRGLTQPETIALALRGLGSRHAAYGVTARDYDTFAAALLWTLAHSLGEEFTAELAEAWRAAYDSFTSAMATGDRGASMRRARD